ncbi:MAG: hypothetical protein ABIA21_01735 [Candidatus Aenigmatarchaeota archaeon]
MADIDWIFIVSPYELLCKRDYMPNYQRPIRFKNVREIHLGKRVTFLGEIQGQKNFGNDGFYYGKPYEVIGSDDTDNSITIKNDAGQFGTYPWFFFGHMVFETRR